MTSCPPGPTTAPPAAQPHPHSPRQRVPWEGECPDVQGVRDSQLPGTPPTRKAYTESPTCGAPTALRGKAVDLWGGQGVPCGASSQDAQVRADQEGSPRPALWVHKPRTHRRVAPSWAHLPDGPLEGAERRTARTCLRLSPPPPPHATLTECPSLGGTGDSTPHCSRSKSTEAGTPQETPEGASPH